jgi:peptidoglycan-N-acetylglucosamine deacetylase
MRKLIAPFCRWNRGCITASAIQRMAMTSLAKLVLFGSLMTVSCYAQAAAFKVLPWNGHKAAISLTFDDARPIQLDVAVPELNKRHLRATFFVSISKLTRIDDWRKARLQGHEIGNHSVTHEHANTLNKATEETQVEDAKEFLESNFSTSVSIFAYPYAELSPGLLYWVKRYDFAARGWRGEGNLLYVTADSIPDWYNLPSQAVFSSYGAEVYREWIDRALSMGAWTTIQIHGIGDPSTGFEPMPADTFIALLDYMKEQESNGLWVAPFGEIAAYLRAQKIVEEARPEADGQQQNYTWAAPSPFPNGVVLKATAEPGRRLYQNGREIRPDTKGEYRIAFDQHELMVRGAR